MSLAVDRVGDVRARLVCAKPKPLTLAYSPKPLAADILGCLGIELHCMSVTSFVAHRGHTHESIRLTHLLDSVARIIPIPICSNHL